MKAFTPSLKSSKSSGFTLVEILIYLAIFIIIGGLSVGVLVTITQINVRESASAEVTGQLNFVIQTINRLVRDSSNIEISVASTTSVLKLRMEDATKDPTCLSLANGVIKLAEGPDGSNPQNCTSNTSDLTTDRVVVNTLNFNKFSQYPGHDTVSVNITMTYNSQNPKSQIKRTLESAIARVSAATFDSDVVPGGSYNFNLGQSGAPWQKVIVADGTAGNPSYTFANDSDIGLFRGGSNILGFSTSGSEKMRIDSNGNVGIGTTTPSAKLYVVGDIRKTGTVSFVEDYPGVPSKQIIYVSLEGPEAGTYIRGTASCENNQATVIFPDYFRLVTFENGLTAQLTPRFKAINLFIKELNNQKLIVGCEGDGQFDYLVNGFRKGYENYQVIQQK